MIVKEVNNVFNKTDSDNRIKFLEAINQLSPEHQIFVSKYIDMLLDLQNKIK